MRYHRHRHLYSSDSCTIGNISSSNTPYPTLRNNRVRYYCSGGYTSLGVFPKILLQLLLLLLLPVLQISFIFSDIQQRQHPQSPQSNHHQYSSRIVSTATAFRSFTTTTTAFFGSGTGLRGGVVVVVSATKTTTLTTTTAANSKYHYRRRRHHHQNPQSLHNILRQPSHLPLATVVAPKRKSFILLNTRGGSSDTIPDSDMTQNSIHNNNTTTVIGTTTTMTSSATTNNNHANIHIMNGNPNANNTTNRWIQIRQTIFPIYTTQETMKFLCIGSIKFFIILALTLTRDMKDTLIVTQCGAEAIAFLKIYGVLPITTFYIAYYSKLSNIISSKQILFYITCIPFFIFFILYDLIIYPNTNILHPSIDTVRKTFQTLGLVTVSATSIGNTSGGGGGIAILISILAHWTSALFYICAEIYSSVSVGLLFWSFANDVVSIEQAKRFYPLFAQMSGLAPVLAGQYMVHYTSRAPNFAMSLHRLTLAITVAGIMICASYYQSCRYVEQTEGINIDDPDTKSMILSPDVNNNSSTSINATMTVATPAIKKMKKKKPKLSMTESAKFLAGSQYLRLIAMLVLGYGLSINFTEIIWKSLVKKLYPNPLDYQRFMGNFSSVVGICTCIVIFFGVHVIRLLGWRVGAMATPSIMAVISVPFFVCILLGIDNHPLRLQTAVLCGTILSLVSKTSKYALFDPTTQMAYIPLDEESKVKGKAAIDVLGSRIGKSGGSFIQQGLVLGFGNILNAAPIVATIYYSVLVAWISAANRLSALFHSTQQQQQSETPSQPSSLSKDEPIKAIAEETMEEKKDK